MIYLTPRRPVKTSAQDCEIRGGEYVAYDRSDYATALKVWLPLAKKEDQVAQTYVGEIYEKGLGVQPDYALASEWYRSAAAQGYARAQINLGYLYEKGLGVQKDPETALHWYRKAAGLSTAITIDPASINTEERQELLELRGEVERRKRESESLAQQLEQTRQQVAQTQRKLERREGDAETERRQLEKVQQELKRQKKQAEATQNNAELKRLEEQQKQRETDLERQHQEITQLRKEQGQLEAEAERYRKQIDTLIAQPVELPNPTIEMIEPLLVTRDGTPSINTRLGVPRVIMGKVMAPAGLQTFTVNDQQEKLDEKGLFRVRIPVQSFNIPVTMVAIDKQGKHTTVEFMFVPEERLEARPDSKNKTPPPSFGDYYALVIGNREYTYWPKLDTPQNDAGEMAEMLSQRYGFKTKVLFNATRYDILIALNELQKKLTDKDSLLIYYAGHGHLDDKGRGYWVPVDGEKDGKANWISNLNITDILNTISAKHILVVADTCYSGALTLSSVARPAAGISGEDRDKWLKEMSEKRSRTVLISGGLKPLKIGAGSQSLFAKALLDVLRENDDILTGLHLYQKISAQVVHAAAKQVPQYAPIQFAGHEAGDFVFVPATNMRQALNWTERGVLHK
jgi:caspase domain-containing protein/Sel1 repeat-containing protein